MSKKAINKLEGGIYWLRAAKDVFLDPPDGSPAEDYMFSAIAVAESLELLAQDVERQLAEYTATAPKPREEGKLDT